MLKILLLQYCRSFGHHQAKEYHVNTGWKQELDSTKYDRSKVMKGFCKTRISVTKVSFGSHWEPMASVHWHCLGSTCILP